MLNQSNLTRAVSLIHSSNLRNRYVALIDDANHIFGEIINERIRGLTRSASVQVPRIILDTVAVSHSLKHLKIIARSLCQPLGFQQLIVCFKLSHAMLKFFAYCLQCMSNLWTLSYIMGCGPNGNGIKLTDNLTGYVAYLSNGFHLIAKELYTQRIFRIGRKNIDNISTNTEHSALKVIVIAVILDIY